MMTYRAGISLALLGAMLVHGAARAQRREPVAAPKPASSVVVDVRSDRIMLLGLTQVGKRLVAVGERGFTLVSDDGGQTWKGVQTPVTRTLTGVAFKDAKVGVAVGHGGSFVRTEDGGNTWAQVTVEEAGPDSLLGVTHLEGDRFVAYGAFGLYFDSQDAGKTWQRVHRCCRKTSTGTSHRSSRSALRCCSWASRARSPAPTTAAPPGSR